MASRLALLTRHFLRRYLDNDLVSPGGDSHVGLSQALAASIVPGLLVVMLVTLKYAQFRLTWDQVADRSLEDAAFYASIAMIVFGLAATLTWDAFYLDSRDQAMLGSLPVHPRLLAMAKLLALAGFLGAFSVASNAIPVVFAPPLMLRGVTGATPEQWCRLTAGHVAASVGGGAWSALIVVAIRGALGCLLPGAIFRRVSPVVQGVLVLLLLGWFISLPQFLLAARGLWQAGGVLRDGMPPFWFVGLHQWIIGRPGPSVAHLAQWGAAAVCATAGVVVLLFLGLPARRQFSGEPSAFVPIAGRSPAARVVAVLSRLLFARRSIERATFQFTLEALARSTMHRLYVAAGIGAGLAWSAGGVLWSANEVFWEGNGLGTANDTGASLASLQAQFILTLMIVASVRFAVTVPVALNASWLFRLTEREPARCYQAGTRAAALTLALGPVLLLVPVQWWAWGGRTAAYHAIVGGCYAVAMTELFFNAYPKPPFAAAYVSGSIRLKTRWLLYFFGSSVLTAGPALIESLLLGRGAASMFLPGALLGTAAILAAGRRRRERHYPFLIFDEAPLDSFQTLAISE